MTKQLRMNNGFGENVPVLCTQDDYKVMAALYQFTKKALDSAGTGSVEDLGRVLDNENVRLHLP